MSALRLFPHSHSSSVLPDVVEEPFPQLNVAMDGEHDMFGEDIIVDIDDACSLFSRELSALSPRRDSSPLHFSHSPLVSGPPSPSILVDSTRVLQNELAFNPTLPSVMLWQSLDQRLKNAQCADFMGEYLQEPFKSTQLKSQTSSAVVDGDLGNAGSQPLLLNEGFLKNMSLQDLEALVGCSGAPQYVDSQCPSQAIAQPLPASSKSPNSQFGDVSSTVGSLEIERPAVESAQVCSQKSRRRYKRKLSVLSGSVELPELMGNRKRCVVLQNEFQKKFDFILGDLSIFERSSLNDVIDSAQVCYEGYIEPEKQRREQTGEKPGNWQRRYFEVHALESVVALLTRVGMKVESADMDFWLDKFQWIASEKGMNSLLVPVCVKFHAMIKFILAQNDISPFWSRICELIGLPKL
jgi:hypothetical protein